MWDIILSVRLVCACLIRDISGINGRLIKLGMGVLGWGKRVQGFSVQIRAFSCWFKGVGGLTDKLWLPGWIWGSGWKRERKRGGQIHIEAPGYETRELWMKECNVCLSSEAPDYKARELWMKECGVCLSPEALGYEAWELWMKECSVCQSPEAPGYEARELWMKESAVCPSMRLLSTNSCPLGVRMRRLPKPGGPCLQPEAPGYEDRELGSLGWKNAAFAKAQRFMLALDGQRRVNPRAKQRIFTAWTPRLRGL